MITDTNASTLYMPRFETVNVAPSRSDGPSARSRTFTANARFRRAILGEIGLVRVDDRRREHRILGGHRDGNVHARVDHDPIVAEAGVDTGLLSQGKSDGLHHDVRHGWNGVRVTRLLELLPQLQGKRHIGVGKDVEMWSRRLRLHHLPHNGALGGVRSTYSGSPFKLE